MSEPLTPGHRPLQIIDHDDPEVVRSAATEDYALHVAPFTWRSGRVSLLMAWYAFASAMFWLIVGATVALVAGTKDTLIGLGLSVLAYSVIGGLISRYAARTGISSALFSRCLFGYLGSVIAPLIIGATALYYGVFEGSVIASVLHQYSGAGPIELWYFIVAAYSIPLVVGGVRKWLDKINGILLPFYYIGLIVVVVWAVARHGYSNDWLTAGPVTDVNLHAPGWFFAFTTYMGVWIMIPFTWDYARLARTADARYHRWLTFGPLFYVLTLVVNAVVGIFLANTLVTNGPLSELSAVDGIVKLAGIFGVALVWISQTRINTANYYLASINAESFFARLLRIHLSRRVWVVLIGIAAFGLMLTNPISYLLKSLQWQGVFVVAWIAIALVYLAFARRDRRAAEDFEFRPGRIPAFNAVGLVSWLVASAAGITLAQAAGPFGATWSAPITFVLAAAMYAIGRFATGERHVVLRRPFDPRAEVEDPWEARIRCASCDRHYVAQEMDRNPATSDHAPICAECGSNDLAYLRASYAEARSGSAGRADANLVPSD
ncbi:thiamine permease [Actinomadura soli]|uniref:Thiamine permease n=1 Tax=Actinomadura soli TaxID=2508997 RepID=A0A5C4JAI3_9ACTN|nr:thiamine permease [Actinomadura soli]TMQ95957.1 thiamine permease [Actinomadura soli]